MHAPAEITQPPSETSSGSAIATHSVGAKKLGDGSNARSVGAGGLNDHSSDGGLGSNDLGLLGRDKHEHGILEHVDSEIDSLGELPNDFLGQASHGKGKVINIHFGDDNVGPSRLQSIDEVEHEHPKLGSGEAGASQ